MAVFSSDVRFFARAVPPLELPSFPRATAIGFFVRTGTGNAITSPDPASAGFELRRPRLGTAQYRILVLSSASKTAQVSRQRPRRLKQLKASGGAVFRQGRGG